MAPRTFLIDGSALAYRSFYTRGPGPLYAYANSLLALIERESPDFALVAMDTPEPTFRHEAFPEYKATRQKTPDELIDQLPVFERIARALGFELYALDGWEADDVIGTLARRAEEAGHEVFLVTGDKDFMQVVDDKVVMYDPTKPGAEAEIRGLDAVREKFNCRPDQVVDVLALMGDSSDNVPGVPGVGEKTARKLIDDYEGLDEIYAKLDELKPPGLRKRLDEGRDLAYLSRDLVTIRTDAPITIGLGDLAYDGPDTDVARDLFVELDFPSLVDRLGASSSNDLEREYRVVTTREQYDAFLAELRAADTVVFDLETTSLEALEAEIVGLAFSFREGEGWYLPANLSEPIFGPGDRGLTARERAQTGVDPDDHEAALFDEHRGPSIDHATTGTGVDGDPLVPPEGSDLARFLADVAPALESPDVAVVGQNIKYDLLVLSRYGVEPANVTFDTMVASFCLAAHQSQHGLDFLSLKHLGVAKIPTSDLIGKGSKQISMWDVPVARCGEYACEDVDMTGRLFRLFEEQLDGADVEHVFRDVEMPVLRVIERMERNGIKVDVERLRALSDEMQERLETLTSEIYELNDGEEFNIASPKQLQVVLFEKLAIHDQLGVKRIKKTKSGYSTDASVLELLSEHPLPAKILQYRLLSKLKGTYVDALPHEVHPHTGRIHTSYNQAGASTGRLSSSDPNLQNIPIRTEEGRRIRDVFVAEEDHVLMAADYSQVELRILAHLSGDEALIDAFREGTDIHQRTASLIFGVSDDDVGVEIRSRAKAINFGIIYGMGAQRLARETGMTTKEAGEFIDQYFVTFPGVRDWLDATRSQAEIDGAVTTLTGRRRKIDGLDGDGRQRAAAMNMAVNTPIQGTAADLMKLAMVAVHRRLADEAPDVRMLLQVHDELVFEVPEGAVDATATIVRETMEGALELDVPLVVDVGSGRTWLEAH